MAAVPLLTLLLILLTLHRSAGSRYSSDWRAAWCAACVFWGVAVVGITELLSLAKALTFPSVAAAWVSVTALLAIPRLIMRRDSVNPARARLARARWPFESRLDSLLLLGVVLIAAVLGLIAVVAPPNNWDSMTYHMSRVAHWLQNGSVAHFPTSIDRQLYAGPWAEFAILQLQVLSGGDRWANLIQWMAMIGSLVGVSTIARQLGGNAAAQLITALVTLAIPMGILQASSTQTDYVTAFWLVCFVQCALVLTREAQQRGREALLVILTGASLGLAILTKGTAYVFALPFLVWLVWWGARRDALYRLRTLSTIALVVLVVNAGHFARNTSMFGNVLGPSGVLRTQMNEIISPATVLSNAIRNVALHMGTPSRQVNDVTLDVIGKAHAAIGLDVNDPRITFSDGTPAERFDIRRPRPHEDLAGNGLHLVLLALAVLVMLIVPGGAESRRRRGYAIAVLTAFAAFCIVSRWQVTGSRLHLPLFVLGAPLIALAATRLLRPNSARVFALFVLMAALPWVVFNESRPLVAREIGGLLESVEGRTIFDTPRMQLYFRNQPALAAPYQAAAKQIAESGCRNVSLALGVDDWEYPFWVLLAAQGGTTTRLSHLVSWDGDSSLGTSWQSEGEHCAVIVTDGAKGVVPALKPFYANQSRMPPVTLLTRRRRVG